MGGGQEAAAGGGLEGLSEWGWHRVGRSGVPRSWRRGPEPGTTPCSTFRRPDGDAATLEEKQPEAGPTSPRLSVGLLRHPPRKVGAKDTAPRETRALIPSPPSLQRGDSALVPPDRLRGGAGERHRRPPARCFGRSSRDPSPAFLPECPLPVPSSPVGLLPRRPRLPAPTRGAVLSGPGGGGAFARPPRPRRKCLPAGTSLTSQGSDVKGRVPFRELWGEEGWEPRGRRSRSAPGRGQRGRPPPPRAARRHLGSRLLTAGPPSVTVSSHGHRRLAPPQDRRPSSPPRPGPPLSLG